MYPSEGRCTFFSRLGHWPARSPQPRLKSAGTLRETKMELETGALNRTVVYRESLLSASMPVLKMEPEQGPCKEENRL